MTEIRLFSMINPHFKDQWTTKRDYIVVKGYRGSLKSSVISMKTVIDMFQMIQDGHKANVISIRENKMYLRDSVYDQVTWAICLFHVRDEIKFLHSY